MAYTLTRRQPQDWSGYSRRIDARMLQEVGALTHPDTRAYVCGPTPLVESVATDLVGLGYPPEKRVCIPNPARRNTPSIT